MATREHTKGGVEIVDTALGKLLDRHEKKAERQNRIIETLPKRSLLHDERERLFSRLHEAESTGAIELARGRGDNSHNIEKIILVDPRPLYRFLDRRVPSDVATEAGERIRCLLPDLNPKMSALLDEIIQSWSAKRNLIRDLSPNDCDALSDSFKLADALLRRDRSKEIDIRTFSRKISGNSKFLENNLGKVADIVRRLGVFPEYLDKNELLESFGVRRLVHPCLISGPITYQGTSLPTHPFIGISPEMVAKLGVEEQPDWILTVENLASFNRQVREAADNGVIIYTGGFPSEATISAIVRLALASNCKVFHWGDIDHGGVKIAYVIEKALSSIGKNLELHMMQPRLAIEFGTPAAPADIFRNIDTSGSVTRILVDFLASEDAHFIEQEELDPSVPIR